MLKPVTETVWIDRKEDKPAFPTVYTPPRHFDLGNPLGWSKGQPFGYFRALREVAPVAWFDQRDAAGFWALTRYDDIKQVELDPETYSSQRGGINIAYGAPNQRKGRLYGAALNTLICLDRPSHIELRMQHRSFFTPDYVAQLKRRVEQKVDDLLDEMEAQGPVVNMVEHFSEKLPLFTLCEMLGVDEKDRPKVKKWMDVLERISSMVRATGLSPQLLWELTKATWTINDMFKYGERVIQDRRDAPRDDLLTAIASAKVDGDPLSQEFLDGSWLLIIFAGNDTTRNSLSGTMRLLTEFPKVKERLIANPDEIGTHMVPEALRMVSPVMHMRRTTTRETEIRGQKIGENEKVVLFYGAANRDPEVFPNPDQFDLDRPNKDDHLAFGLGPHVCLGQRIAAMQLEVAYRKILERFPRAQWTGKIDILPGNFVHGIHKLEVDLGA